VVERRAGTAQKSPVGLDTFAGFEAWPQSMSIEERVRRMMTGEEWEKECREYG